jgi:hypothetical protein
MGTLSSAKISGKLLANYMLNTEYEKITGKYFDRDQEAFSTGFFRGQGNEKSLCRNTGFYG